LARPTWIPVLLCVLALGLPGQAAPKARAPKGPAVSQLQSQLKKALAERDEARERLAATEGLQEELAAAQRSRELAKGEADEARRELEQLKATLSENQNSGESIFRDLKKAKEDLAASQALVASLRKELAEPKRPVVLAPTEGISALGLDDVPARPMNLARVTPKVRKADSGVVVVSVLVGENGEVLAARLLQPLPGEGEPNRLAGEACVEAAKRIVFDPARSADGKTRLRVWQAVGFWLE
jgi:hypothetical protein